MKRRTMGNCSWATNITILLFLLGIIMLAILLFSALQLKPSQDSEVLKHFDASFLKKAADYNRVSLLLSIAERFLSWIFMAGIILIFWKNSYTNNRVNIFLAFALFAAFIILLYIILLPLQYYRGFILEHRFGLSNQGFLAWFGDVLKSRAIFLFINTLALTLIYALMLYLPRSWWITAAAIFVVFIIAANFIFPVLIDPLFYKFTPLENKNLENRIMKMADEAEIKIDRILVADASKKTNRINAYFTGIGSTKRIVIYDNLVNKNTEDEVLSVVAHEMGHWKYRHIFISIFIASVSVIVLLFLLKLMQGGFNSGVSLKLVLLMFVCFTLISYITMPLQNFISRQFEKQADKAAIELTKNPDTAISIFKNLANSNLSNVDPGPILKYIIYSHPPIIERIKNAETFTLRNTD